MAYLIAINEIINERPYKIGDHIKFVNSETNKKMGYHVLLYKCDPLQLSFSKKVLLYLAICPPFY